MTDPSAITELQEIKELLKSMLPKEPVPDDVWVTRDGRRIHIVEMTDTHLVNTLLYLKHKYVLVLKMDQRKNWRDSLPDYARVKFHKLEEEALKRGFTDWESKFPIQW